MNRVTGIVMAGGKSSRMGTNKALIVYNGKTLIEHAVLIVESLVSNIIISSNIPILQYQYINIPDNIKEIGPIGGLYSCLLASDTVINLVIPCDAPNVSNGLYQLLINNLQNFDAVIPMLPNGRIEPLIACYNKSIIPEVKKAIDIGDYKLVNLLSKLNVKYIKVSDVNQFKNFNTPNDMLKY